MSSTPDTSATPHQSPRTPRARPATTGSGRSQQAEPYNPVDGEDFHNEPGTSQTGVRPTYSGPPREHHLSSLSRRQRLYLRILLTGLFASLLAVITFAAPQAANGAPSLQPDTQQIHYRLVDDPGSADDTKLSDNSIGPFSFHGAGLTHDCGTEPAACSIDSAQFSETVWVHYQIWQRHDGLKPTNYYVITEISATLIIPGHKLDEFSPIGRGNLISISDQDPCGVRTLGTTDYGEGNPVDGPQSQDPNSAVVPVVYDINKTFLMPTVHASGGAFYNKWSVENGAQGFNVKGDVPQLGNSC